MDPATSADVREAAAAIRDLAGVVRDMAADVERLPGIEKELAEIRRLLVPAEAYFDALNREHAATIASAAEASSRRRVTLNEWFAWLTPRRAVGIIVTLGALCGFGGPATGVAGRVQAAWSAAVTALSEAP